MIQRLLVLVPLALLAAPGAARAEEPHGFRCGTPHEVARIEELKAIPKPRTLHLGGDKLVRDPFGTHQKLLSPNFAINWGNANLTPEQAQRVADAAEDSWATFVTTLGHPPPTGCDTYRLNIYVSWDDDNPAIDYDGGYATLDNQGYPYLVISKNLVNSVDSVQGVVSHEIYHDFQFSTDAYWSDESSWWWEATAEWGAQQVYPGSQNAYGFVGALALTQELSLYFMGDPFAMDPTGQHQYGAGLFPRYLTDRVGDPSLVPRSWLTASGNDDPLDVLDDLMPDGDVAGGVDTIIAEFYAHNALWDYPQLALFGWSIGSYEATYPTYKQVVAPVILSAGTNGFVEIAPTRPLHEHGAHHLVLSAGADKTLDIAIDGADFSSGGAPATWWATVIRTSPTDGIIYTPVPFDGSDGALTVVLPDDEGSARLTIGVHGDGKSMNATYDYLLSVGAEPDAPGADAGVDPEDPPPGCCSTGGTPASGSIALSLLVLVLARRRRT